MVIPSRSSLIPKLLFEFHDSAVGGQNGEFKTYLRFTRRLVLGCYAQKGDLICSSLPHMSDAEGVPSAATRSPTTITHPHSGLGKHYNGLRRGLTLPKSGGFDIVLVVVKKGSLDR